MYFITLIELVQLHGSKMFFQLLPTLAAVKFSAQPSCPCYTFDGNLFYDNLITFAATSARLTYLTVKIEGFAIHDRLVERHTTHRRTAVPAVISISPLTLGGGERENFPHKRIVKS